MQIQSNLPKELYLNSMKMQMGSFYAFGSERFVGTILGRFFSITYCSGWEWNRQITNEKNRAIGYVRAGEHGTEVHCIRLAGFTNPLSLISFFVIFLTMFAAFGGFGLALSAIASLCTTILTAAVTALTDSLTERGQEGQRIVTAFLHNPQDFYGNIYHY